LLHAPNGADGVERADAPASCVQSNPMMAPTLVVLVRVLWLIVRHHKHDVYWMVTDLVYRKTPESYGKSLEMAEEIWSGKRIGTWSGPEGREYRVESQAINQAPDHHPRL
jgi:hypothetical protein